VPQDYCELAALFRFVIDEIKMGESLRCDGADFDMLSNIHDALFGVLCAERKTALQKGMINMRDFLNRKTGLAFDTSKESDIMERIGWGAA
jgi:hypothetical protein